MNSMYEKLKKIPLLKKVYRKIFHSDLKQENLRLQRQVAVLEKKVSILTETKKKYFKLADRFSDLKEHYLTLKKYPWTAYLLRCFKFADFCVSCAPDEKYDICLAHNHNSLAAAFEFAERNQADVIFDAVEITHLRHAAGPAAKKFKNDERGSRAIELYEGSFIERCAGIFTVSPGLQKWLPENYSVGKPILLRNCREYLPLKKDAKIRTLCNLQSGEKLILYIGSVYQSQGVEQVLDALAELPGKYHFATLGAWRNSEYLAEITSLATQLNIVNRVHFLKPVSSVELVSFASGADFGIIPRQATSLNNQFSLPNRIFEIVMARLPVAVGDLPDLKDLVNDLQTGVVFDERSPESIAHSILTLEQLAASPEIEEKLEKAASTLSWDKEKKNLIGLLDGLRKSSAPCAVALFANKSVRTNNRLYRICKTLVENQYDVTLFSKDEPQPDLKVPGVVYMNCSSRQSGHGPQHGKSPLQ